MPHEAASEGSDSHRFAGRKRSGRATPIFAFRFAMLQHAAPSPRHFPNATPAETPHQTARRKDGRYRAADSRSGGSRNSGAAFEAERREKCRRRRTNIGNSRRTTEGSLVIDILPDTSRRWREQVSPGHDNRTITH